MALTEVEFERLAEGLLSRIAEAVEAAESDGVEVELQGPVLTIAVDSEGKAGGTFVVNKHAPTRQIWLSSPVSGASHFELRDGAWRSTRDDAVLLARLADELRQCAGLALDLD